MKEQFAQAVELGNELLVAKDADLTPEQSENLRQKVQSLYESTDDQVARYKIILNVIGHRFTPSLPLLRSALFEDSSALIRHECAFGLAEIEGNAAQPLLIRALQDEHGLVRHEAAEMLGWYGDKGAIDPLTPLLSDPDADWYVAGTVQVAIEMIQLRL